MEHAMGEDQPRPMDRYDLLCRACLAESKELKNIYQWGLNKDWEQCTGIPLNSEKDLSDLLCRNCERQLLAAKTFRSQCLNSHYVLQAAARRQEVTQTRPTENAKENTITCTVYPSKLVICISAPNMEAKIYLTCPYCTNSYIKKKDLSIHLAKVHHISSKSFQIDLQYYCSINTCSYFLNSGHNKFFQGRKFLNQHYHKVHSDMKFSCAECQRLFPTYVLYKHHLKTCNMTFACQACEAKYNCNERLMVHLKRKHPVLHRQLKTERKTRKRKSSTTTSTKVKQAKVKSNTVDNDSDSTQSDEVTAQNKTYLAQNDSGAVENDADGDQNGLETAQNDIDSAQNDTAGAQKETDAGETISMDYTLETDSEGEKSLTFAKTSAYAKSSVYTEICDSPKRSFATQTRLEDNIKNDVTLPSWQLKSDNYEIKTDEISTQTGFEDLLSLKSQASEDDSIFFSETVSLSDIQTQTFPIDFGLSRSNKETLTNETQSPDLSIKETQTCFCLYDSPKLNYRLFDSVSSSPCSLNLATTETQTQDRITVKSDVLLSFSSAQTQTTFEEFEKDSF